MFLQRVDEIYNCIVFGIIIVVAAGSTVKDK